MLKTFTKVRLYSLKLHPNKCEFYYDKVVYLNHTIFPDGLGVIAIKVALMVSISRPKDVGSFWKLVKTFSTIKKLLTMMTRNDQLWI